MSTPQSRTYAKRISREESERRIIDATITLLRNGDFNGVSSRKIATLAGVHGPTISRLFGSMASLYAAVAYELAQRSLAESGEDLQTAALGPDLVMRSRLVAWCLANGADPELFMTSRESLGGQALLARQAAFAPVSSRANYAFTEIVRFAFEGFAVLGPTHAYSERQMTDAIAMIQALRRRLPDVERDLGWETGELDTQSDRPRD